MSRIDYSKWDKLEVSSSDDEKKEPKVSRFDNPKSISFGENKPWSAHESRKIKSNTPQTPDEKTLNKERSSSNLTSSNPIEIDNYIRNGGIHYPKYFWMQSLRQVTIFVVISPQISVKDLAISIQEKSILVQLLNSSFKKQSPPEIILQGQFPYPIEDSDEQWYWETINLKFNWKSLLNYYSNQEHIQDIISDEHLRVIKLELMKKSLFSDSFIWWDCFLKGDSKIDVTQIHDRLGANQKHSDSNKISNDQEAKYKQFKEVWDIAHSQFREKVKRNEKVIISDSGSLNTNQID